MLFYVAVALGAVGAVAAIFLLCVLPVAVLDTSQPVVSRPKLRLVQGGRIWEPGEEYGPVPYDKEPGDETPGDCGRKEEK